MNPSAEMLAYVKRNLCLNDIEIIYLENIHEQCKTQRAKILKRLEELRNINVDLTNAQNPGILPQLVIKETLAATAAAVVLESICKVNKQPISSTRTRQVNSTSTRPPSPPDPIHQYRSKYP
ncbi:unnamed protein product [Rotaria magnacalcarata]